MSVLQPGSAPYLLDGMYQTVLGEMRYPSSVLLILFFLKHSVIMLIEMTVPLVYFYCVATKTRSCNLLAHGDGQHNICYFIVVGAHHLREVIHQMLPCVHTQ